MPRDAVSRPASTQLRQAWPLIGAGFVIAFVLVGGGINTVSVFLNAIAHATDWSRSSLSLAVSVGALSAALATPLVGAAVDRVGVRLPMAIGALLLAGGFAILIAMSRSWHFVAANVVLGAGFAAAGMFPITLAVTVSVPDRTSLALGIVGAGSSAGALVMAPSVQSVIDALGWRGAYVAMGAMVVLTPLPLIAFVLPRGRLDSRAATATRARSEASPRARWLPGMGSLAAVMMLPALATFSVAVHLVPYLTGLGHAGAAAAAALGATIGISAIGKIGGGYIADRWGALPTLRAALVLWIGALAALHHAAAIPMLSLFVCLYGVALGTQLSVIPTIAVSILGNERFGALFGLLQLGAALAAAIGPVASGMIFDATGAYDGALALWIAAVSGAAIVAWLMHPTATSVAAVEQVTP